MRLPGRAWLAALARASFMKTIDRYQPYFTGCTDEMNDCQIGVATGMVAWQAP